MSFQGAYTLQSPINTGDPTLPLAVRDGILTGELNSGVRHLFDLGFGFCYPGGALLGRPAPAAPANNAAISDVAERTAASFVLAGGQTVNYAGGGFDFSALTARGSYLSIPASVANDIWTPFGGSAQRFLVFGYFKLPAQADWHPGGSFSPFLSFGSSSANPGAADMVTIAQSAVGALSGIRQTVGATVVNTKIIVPASAFGQMAQLAYWRNDGGVGITLRTVPSGRTTTTDVVGADNTENFAARDGRFGVGTAYYGTTLTGQTTAVKFRMYRGGVINLARWTGLDPVATLEADWARTQTRIAASAAANGGTSLIFA